MRERERKRQKEGRGGEKGEDRGSASHGQSLAKNPNNHLPVTSKTDIHTYVSES